MQYDRDVGEQSTSGIFLKDNYKVKKIEYY